MKQSPLLGSKALPGLIARWILGVFFIYMGCTKAIHPEVFLKQVHEYHVITNPVLLNVIAAGLPWFEVFCGLLLFFGIAVRGSALLVALMLLPFTVLVVHRAVGLAGSQGVHFWLVKFDCGCGTGEVVIWRKVLENSLFLLLSLWMFAGGGRPLALRYSLFRPPEKATSPKPEPTGQHDLLV